MELGDHRCLANIKWHPLIQWRKLRLVNIVRHVNFDLTLTTVESSKSRQGICHPSDVMGGKNLTRRSIEHARLQNMLSLLRRVSRFAHPFLNRLDPARVNLIQTRIILGP